MLYSAAIKPETWSPSRYCGIPRLERNQTCNDSYIHDASVAVLRREMQWRVTVNILVIEKTFYMSSELRMISTARNTFTVSVLWLF